jgi:predicted Zn-dependent protease with MMP-like domain
MREIPMEEFEELVADALDEIPDELAVLMDNVVVIVEDDPPEPGLLGLYEGVPLTERGDYGGMVLPDRVTIYRRPLCATSTDPDEVVEQIAITVIHEIAHHFGIDDDRLDDLGWG